MLLHALVALTDPADLAPIASQLDRIEGLVWRSLPRGEDLWDALAAGATDLLLAEGPLLGEDPEAVVHRLRSLPEGVEVAVLSLSGRADRRADLLAAGAFAVIDRSASTESIGAALAAVVERLATQRDLSVHAASRAEAERRLSDMASDSPVMREFLAFVRKVVDTDSTLLVQGETGTGKEYLSRAIHYDGPRNHGPFVAVNCSALSPTLLESELFGHVEGAFTGASRQRRGYFELAHNGTLFLDEIGELTPQVQVKMLRVLQSRRIQPVGAEEEVEIDVRLIAATNRDLNREMEHGRFRPDLFYRLSVVTLIVPPLRRRPEDIAGLVATQIEAFRLAMNRDVRGITDEAVELLRAYLWPGNVRELINVVERGVLLCGGDLIEASDLPAEVHRAAGTAREAPVQTAAHQPKTAMIAEDPGATLLERSFTEARAEHLLAFERRYLEALLRRCHGRVGDAARIANLNPRTLYQKMQRLGLQKEFFKLPADTPPR